MIWMSNFLPLYFKIRFSSCFTKRKKRKNNLLRFQLLIFVLIENKVMHEYLMENQNVDLKIFEIKYFLLSFN
jgi:hypothetical protein